jgi:hypothetical protein
LLGISSPVERASLLVMIQRLDAVYLRMMFQKMEQERAKPAARS